MEILKTQGAYRVGVELDTTPDEPYDDGSSPLVRIDIRHGEVREATQVERTTFRLDDDILAAVRRFGTDLPVLERYLRIFHGATSFVSYQYDTGSYLYVTFDTAAWRAAMGLDDAWRRMNPDAKLASLDEWIAYCQGDVYGYLIQQRVTWQRKDFPDHTREEWETVDSCWGYYGREYAEEAALEAFEAQLAAGDPEPCAYPGDVNGEHDHDACKDSDAWRAWEQTSSTTEEG